MYIRLGFLEELEGDFNELIIGRITKVFRKIKKKFCKNYEEVRKNQEFSEH